MTTSAKHIIAEKYSELVGKVHGKNSIARFTKPERMIWYIVTIACDIDMEGFDSIFVQALTLAEINESIGYMNELGLTEIAKGFEQVIEIYKANEIYDSEGELVGSIFHLPKEIQDKVDDIGREISRDRLLWAVDDKLYEFLQADDQQ